MSKSIVKNRKVKKSKGFDPNRDFLNEAVKDYVKRGGKITKIIDVTEDYDRFCGHNETLPPADDFLMGA